MLLFINSYSLSIGPGNDLQTKLKKMTELANTDKDVIDTLYKKLNTQKIDFDTLQ